MNFAIRKDILATFSSFSLVDDLTLINIFPATIELLYHLIHLEPDN